MSAGLELSTSQAARVLGVTIGTVRRRADRGYLPTFRTPGGQRRFRREDLERFVESLREPVRSDG